MWGVHTLPNIMYLNTRTELIEPFGISRTTDSSSELVSVAEAKAHLRVTHSDDDAYIGTLITASRQSLEISTRRSLGASQTYKVFYDSYPTTYFKLLIPNPPLTSFTSLKYYDDNDVLQTIPSNQYTVETAGSGASFLSMKDTHSFPTVSIDRVAPVEIEFVSGYTAQTFPKPLHQAILLLVAHYYDTREPVSFGDIPHKIQRTVDFIADQYKVKKFF